ncbi:ABC transporter substrate-binding protein [Streptomyces neyagawaensis]|uniref:ABC transporter substrate-binding protein n=1 Tax=Streptomyces neyagawaensis TaxID=42238 RepID=UPI0006E3B313|nr:extracellular solute-binding protein [Streptomyces neyagawaensis]MCL6733488.1 extracellular solute-binding protein [Streptomyces neyagawaensis]MDE1685301.1 extracellular solute-binding protein [Streptomyces neyagawaensis]
MPKQQHPTSPVRTARRRPRTPLAAVAAASALATLAACGAPGSDSDSGSADATPTAVNTAVADKSATLTLFSAAGLEKYEQGLADAFMAQYPKIKVKLRVEADNNYNTVLPRLLASDSTPDIVQPYDLLGGVKDNLLTNLNAYDEAYGWSEKVPASALAPGRVSDGVIGSGPLYQAGGSAGPLVGVFYNKELANKVGMKTVPSSISELEDVMAKAKKSGVTPIVASNQDGLIGHLYNLLLGDYMGAQSLSDLVHHKPGASLDTPEAVKATKTLQKWIKAGYFTSDVNALNQEASYGKFTGGKGLFFFQGSWITQTLDQNFKGEYGAFPMPPAEKGGKYAGMTSNTLAFSIAARSKNKDAAALFLDFLTTPKAAEVAVDNGYAALTSGASDAAEPSLSGTLTEQIQTGYAAIAADNGFDSWLQNSAPAVGTKLTQQLQLLVSGKVEPAAMVKTLQTAYADALKSS